MEKVFKDERKNIRSIPKAVLQAAIQDDLPVSFADKLTQNEFLRLKEVLSLERKKFVANGGTFLMTPKNKPNSNT